MLRRLGVDRWLAWNTAKSAHGSWRLSASSALHRALPNRYFRNLGLPELAARWSQRDLNRRGTWSVCPVVWEEGHREVPPYPDYVSW